MTRYYQHLRLAFILLFFAALGFGAITLLREPSSSKAPNTEKLFQRRGVVEYISPDKEFIIAAIPSAYTADGVNRQKIYLIPSTRFEESRIYMENDVITYERTPLPGSIDKLSAGDEVMLKMAFSDQRFVALYIRYGTPTPGI